MSDAAIVEIAEYQKDVESALKHYFGQITNAPTTDPRTRAENDILLTARLVETNERSAFFVLARLEAAFRIDYEARCRMKMKDNLSRAFRKIWKSQELRVRLDEDLFELWRAHIPTSSPLIPELRSAFRFRNWLAHGRSGKPKLGRKYDFNYTFDLAEAVFSSLPLRSRD
jgi:hypothetical protein